ncbi:MAG: serine hydrolase [Pseudomonadota bacterium]
MLRKILLGLAALVALSIAFALMWAIRPWTAHEPGRWYLSWPPQTRAYNFSHWHKVVPYQTVSASSNPRLYERNPIDLSDVTFVGADGPMTIGDYLESEGISGMMVLQAGDIRFEHYDRGIDADSRYHIWSATKSFTSTLIGIALHQGVIDDIDDPIKKYAAQFDGTVYGNTSIRHVLMMSSGVNLIHDPGHKPSRRELYNAIIFDGENLDDFAARLEYRVDPGTDFNYAATDTHVLGAVLRAAYGQKLGQIATEQLWQPAGFTADAIWSENAAGKSQAVFAHCCLALTLTDFAHLGQIYLEDLIIDGAPSVPSDWFEQVENAQAPFQEPTQNPETGNIQMGYSYQFWLPENYQQEFVARGALGQYLWVDRKRGFVVAQFAIKSGDGITYSAAMRAIGDAVAGSN